LDFTILGCGRWGSFLAWYLNGLGHKVILWGRENSEKYCELKLIRKNKFVELPISVALSNNIQEALDFSNYIIIAIEGQNIRSLMAQIVSENKIDKTFILCMKGLEEDTGFRLSEVVKEYTQDEDQILVWLGPGHPRDFVKGIPNCMIIDSVNLQLKQLLSKEFGSSLIKIIIGNDMIGNEIGAAMKNVIGIVGGIFDGLGWAALKGILMSYGTLEIARLIHLLGGNFLSAFGVACLGEYEASMFSEESNSRKFGYSLARGQIFRDYAPGLYTSHAIISLMKRKKIDSPLFQAINKLINRDITPDIFLSYLTSYDQTVAFQHINVHGGGDS